MQTSNPGSSIFCLLSVALRGSPRPTVQESQALALFGAKERKRGAGYSKAIPCVILLHSADCSGDPPALPLWQMAPTCWGLKSSSVFHHEVLGTHQILRGFSAPQKKGNEGMGRSPPPASAKSATSTLPKAPSAPAHPPPGVAEQAEESHFHVYIQTSTHRPTQVASQQPGPSSDWYNR